MSKLVVFNQVSLDGYFVDANGNMDWAHNPQADEEWGAFVESNARGGGVLVFGRRTYELMKSYWPTPQAMQNDPIVAERMNSLPKVVFSRTLDKADWQNTRLVKEHMPEEIIRMKHGDGMNMAIIGSGNIVSQLSGEGLIDEYQIVVIPVILGNGRTMFEGVDRNLPLELVSSKAFGNGNVLLCYKLKA